MRIWVHAKNIRTFTYWEGAVFTTEVGVNLELLDLHLSPRVPFPSTLRSPYGLSALSAKQEPKGRMNPLSGGLTFCLTESPAFDLFGDIQEVAA